MRTPRTGPLARRLRAAAALALALVGIACRDRGAPGPGLPVPVQYGIAPSFGLVAGGPVFQLSAVRVRLYEIPSGALVSDTVAAFAAGKDSLALRLAVRLLRPTQQFALRLAAVDATGDTLFRGGDTVTLRQNDAAPVPSEVLLHYSGPDTAAARLAIAPRDTVITVGEPLRMRASAYRVDGSPLPAVRAGWTSSDTNLVKVAPDGTVLALAAGGPTWLHGRSATGLVDSTQISATLRVGAVALSPDTLTLMPTATAQLTATVLDIAGKALPLRPVAWTSSDALVATVSPKGVVTGVAPGTATIVGESGGVSDSTRLTVALLPVTSVDVTPDSATVVSFGDRITYSATVFDASGKPLSGAAVVWTLDTPGIAILDSVGPTTVQVVATAGGQTIVRATVQGAADAASFTVQQRIASIAVAPPTVTLGIGAVFPLSAQASDARGNAMPNVGFTWSSDAPLIAAVGRTDGVVSTLALGTAKITAAADGLVSNPALVTVSPAP